MIKQSGFFWSKTSRARVALAQRAPVKGAGESFRFHDPRVADAGAELGDDFLVLLGWERRPDALAREDALVVARPVAVPRTGPLCAGAVRLRKHAVGWHRRSED